ncbi:hypothetical protein DBV15_00002, partial [Temnothorax longispinosus]
CVPGKGSFQRQAREKARKSAFREAQFLREARAGIHRDSAPRLSHRRARGVFSRNRICAATFLAAPSGHRDVHCSSSRVERKRSLKMRPGLRRATRRGMRIGKKVARTRRLNGDANCTRG